MVERSAGGEGEVGPPAVIMTETTGGRPDINPWPEESAVVVAWQQTAQLARVVALSDGNIWLLEHEVARPEARWVSRPATVATPRGLVVATGVCFELDDEGFTEVELVHADGTATDSLTLEGCGQPRVAASQDHVAVMWGDGDDGYQVAILRVP